MAKPVTPRQRVRAGRATMVSPQGKGTIFDYYNDRGLIPVKDPSGHRFRNFEEFKNLVQTATTAYLNANPGVTPTKALNFTLSRLELLRKLRTNEWLDSFDEVVKASEAKKGTIYKGIPFKINEDGIVDFDKRKYMSNLPQPVYDYIADTRGEDVAKEYKKAVKKEWEDMGARGREFKGKTGVEVHRGHWLANKFGGAESARAGDLEIAMMNVLHGADPRGNIEAVKESSRSSMGWLDDFYEWDLVNNKLNVPGSELLTVEDLQGISADEVDVNQRIAQRLDEQRMGTLPEDRVGNLFGSEVREGETLEQARFRKKEEQARFILENDYNPQTGNDATPKDLTDAQKTIREAELQMKATPVGPRAQTSVVKSRPELFQQLPPEPMPSGVQPTPKQFPPLDPELVSSANDYLLKRINRRLGKNVFDDTLDTTTETYQKNIGRMQPFLDLSDEERAALNLYGQDGTQYYADLNRSLRTGVPFSQPESQFLQTNLDSMLSKLAAEPAPAYRVVSGSNVSGIGDLKVGDTYTDFGYGSFSSDEKGALRFTRSGKPNAIISVKNSSARNISPAAEYEEGERLAPRNTKYKVVGIEEVPNPKGGVMPKYIMEEVPRQEIIKVIPRGIKQKGGKVSYQRQMVRNLAVAGVGGLSVLGTAASAAETGMRAGMAAESFQRGDIGGGLMDVGQTVLSGLSTAADVVPGIGEVVSTPADIANIVIDEARMPQEVKQQQEQARQSAQAKSRARNLRRGTGARRR